MAGAWEPALLTHGPHCARLLQPILELSWPQSLTLFQSFVSYCLQAQAARAKLLYKGMSYLEKVTKIFVKNMRIFTASGCTKSRTTFIKKLKSPMVGCGLIGGKKTLLDLLITNSQILGSQTFVYFLPLFSQMDFSPSQSPTTFSTETTSRSLCSSGSALLFNSTLPSLLRWPCHNNSDICRLLLCTRLFASFACLII